MIKTVVAVWIYVAGLVATLVSAGHLSMMLRAHPPAAADGSQITMAWARQLQSAPTVLGVCLAATAILGVYLWRSRRPLETRLFAAAVIAALNLFLCMYFWMAMAKLANAG